MILFATKHKKYHLLYTPVNQCITKIFKLIMILWDFSFKKTIKQPATLPIFFTSSIRTWLLLNPLEKVIFDNFFICNHLIIKWHFVGKRTKNYFLKWAHYWSFASFCPTRPEGAEALSPGYRPGLLRTQTWCLVRAKALKLLIIYKAFALTCRVQLRNVWKQ